jgi:RHS repeat-associated protein
LNTSTATYGYDGNGQRVTKTAGGQTITYVYDVFGNLAAEYGGTTSAPCAPCYLTVDALGSTRVVTDGRQGTVKARHDYMPFGDELFAGTGARTTGQGYLNVGSAEGINTLFTGQYRDTELASSALSSGLDYFMARHMAPGLGRFLQPDPGNVGAVAGFPQTWHGYGYVANNPMANTDPYGLFCPATGCYPPPEIDPCSIQLCFQPTPSEPTTEPEPQTPPAKRENPTIPGNNAGWFANKAKRIYCGIAAPLTATSAATKRTVGVGLGGNAGVGWIVGVAVSAGFQVVADPQGNVGFSLTLGGNPGYSVFGAGAIGGAQASASTVQNIYDTRGFSLGAGLSGGDVGAIGYDVAHSRAGTTVTGTLGFGAGGKGAAFSLNYTFVPLPPVNCKGIG